MSESKARMAAELESMREFVADTYQQLENLMLYGK